jgi:hypothetical protein
MTTALLDRISATIPAAPFALLTWASERISLA